jgi:hypothetical protein
MRANIGAMIERLLQRGELQRSPGKDRDRRRGAAISP